MPKPPVMNQVYGSAPMPNILAQKMAGMKVSGGHGAMLAEPLAEHDTSPSKPGRGISDIEREALINTSPLGVGALPPSPLNSGGPRMATSSTLGRAAVGPGSAGLLDSTGSTPHSGGPRQLTAEDMSRIVAGTDLQASEPSQKPSLRSLDLGMKLPSPLDLSKQTRLDDGESNGCFHVRHVEVAELLEDNTLGLLLHGTSVVGFCSSRAESAGWCVGDQIVEVNGQRVGSFEEFLERFVQSQAEHGLPIDFSVLRREQKPLAGEADEAEDALENFFSATNFVDLAGQLQKKFGATSERNPSFDGEEMNQIIRSDSMSILENPYIQALKKRRDELLLSTEGWTGAVGTPSSASIASRLATRKDAGIATLEDAGGPQKPCGWPFCISENREKFCREAPVNEVMPTPRVDRFEALDTQCLNSTRKIHKNASTWAVFDASENAAYLSTPCADTGLLVTAGYHPSSSARMEKENSGDGQARLESSGATGGTDGPSSDEMKNSGAPDRPQNDFASRNFASRLLPLTR